MNMKRAFFLVNFLVVLVLILSLNNVVTVQAESARSVETGGSIGFSGVYIPEIEPPSGLEPVSPDEVSPKPDKGRLPQMGQFLTQQCFWIGMLLLLLLFVLIERNRNHRKQVMSTFEH